MTDSSKRIFVTKYHRPCGHRTEEEFFVPDRIFDLSQDMIVSMEVLTTGETAVYAKLAGKRGEDEAMTITRGTPESVLRGLCSVIEKAYTKKEPT